MLNSDIAIIQADARRIPLKDATVQCVVTSPPYWGLRKYAGAQELVWPHLGLDRHPQDVERCPLAPFEHEWMAATTPSKRPRVKRLRRSAKAGEANAARLKAGRWRESNTCSRCGAWRGAYGLEPTIEMYVQHTVEILREIRRALRPDGVVFWNIGDSYATGAGSARIAGGDCFGKANSIVNSGDFPASQPNRMPQRGLKPKDLCLIPARVALAAQADGWWVRSLIIWAKPNPMPESVTDRPTDAYEHILMLTKSERYFWDADAVREPAEYGRRSWSDDNYKRKGDAEHPPERACGYVGEHDDPSAGRNLRNMWMFATQPYSGAHFATFPEEIPRRCILAATSERGACAQCGAPWERITENKPMEIRRTERGQQAGNRTATSGTMIAPPDSITIGWQPTCRCAPRVTDHESQITVPCLVLDPFAGSGTTGRVAAELNRRAVLLDLAYHDHAEKRTSGVQRRIPIL